MKVATTAEKKPFTGKRKTLSELFDQYRMERIVNHLKLTNAQVLLKILNYEKTQPHALAGVSSDFLLQEIAYLNVCIENLKSTIKVVNQDYELAILQVPAKLKGEKKTADELYQMFVNNALLDKEIK
jgi:hypothetical protein